MPSEETVNLSVHAGRRSLPLLRFHLFRHPGDGTSGGRDLLEAKAGIASWINFYNEQRLHQHAANGLARRNGQRCRATCPQQQQKTKPLAA
jgi:hypothetical protein